MPVMEYRDRRPVSGLARALRNATRKPGTATTAALRCLEAEFLRGLTARQLRKTQAELRYFPEPVE